MVIANLARGLIKGRAGWRSTALYFISYLMLCVIAHSLRIQPSEPALIWPPAGLFMPYLAGLRLRFWPQIVLVSFVAELLAELLWTGTLDTPYTFIYSFINVVEATCGALIFAWLVPKPWQRRQSLELVAFLVLCGTLAPLIGGLLAALVTHMTTGSLAGAVSEFGAWWLGDFLGIMLVAPIMGGAVLRAVMKEPIPRRVLLEATLALLAVSAVLVVLLRVDNVVGDFSSPIRFALVIAVLLASFSWFALRHEPIVVASASFVATLTISICIVAPDSPLRFTFGQNRNLVEAAQIFVLACALSAFVAAVALFERRNVRRLLMLRQSAGLLLSDVSLRLSASTPESLDADIDTSLQAIGRYAGADRCIIFEMEVGSEALTQTRRWVRPGIADSKMIAEHIPVATFSNLVKEISEGRSEFIRRSDYPHNHPIHRFFVAIGTKAGLYSPLTGKNQVRGAIGLIWVKRSLRAPGELLMVLQSLGQAIGNARIRVEADSAANDYRNRLQQLAVELNRVDDKVRRETAIDLHDRAAQNLAVGHLRLQQLKSSSIESSDTLDVVDTMVCDALDQIRDVIDRLSPTVLYELGLVPALESLAENASREVGISITLEADKTLAQPTNDHSVLFYRAARELLTNAIKHANASTVLIRLTQDDDHVILAVIDDGDGMELSNPNDATGKGLGIFNLRERITHLDGQLQIESDGNGTTVTLKLPHSH